MLVRALFFSLILLFPVADLLMAYLYQQTGSELVVAIRYYRDLVTLGLGGLGFLNKALPYQIRLACLAYGGLLALYSMLTLVTNLVPVSVLLASAGTLVIPMSLTLAGFTAIRTEHDMKLFLRLLIIYAVVSIIFGMWEINNTEFWVDTIGLGNYLVNIKGVLTGFQPTVFLPWNFSGLDFERRAAGLLAAPLAQGFFVAVIGMLAFSFLRMRSLPVALLVGAFCFYGVYMTSTRGAMMAYGLGVLIYFLLPSKRTNYALNIMILVAAAVLMIGLSYKNIMYSVELKDHSTIGHLRALSKNMESLSDVVLFGHGVGSAGAKTSAASIAIAGGGEGALFSIVYQLGLPGGLIFLWYYGRLFFEVMARRRADGLTGEIARSLVGLFLGVLASMFTSEHILTFSGMAAFWFALGGFLGYTRRMPVAAPLAARAAAPALPEPVLSPTNG